jgi:hypothetical protein
VLGVAGVLAAGAGHAQRAIGVVGVDLGRVAVHGRASSDESCPILETHGLSRYRAGPTVDVVAALQSTIGRRRASMGPWIPVITAPLIQVAAWR